MKRIALLLSFIMLFSFSSPSMALPQTTKVTRSEATSILKEIDAQNCRLLYVVSHESPNSDRSITINLSKSNQPTILFIKSQDAVNWKIENPYKVPLKAIFFGADESGSTVKGIDASVTKVFEMPELQYSITFLPNVSKMGHDYRAEHMEFRILSKMIVELTGKKLDGFTGGHSQGVLKVPEILLDSKTYVYIDNEFANVDRMLTEEPQKPENLFAGKGAKPDDGWGKYLNPKGEVPLNKFKAFYFDTIEPVTVHRSEYSRQAAISYMHSDFLGIESNDFGAYWVGDFLFDSKTVKEINLAQSDSFTRIRIDGKTVYSGEERTSFPYEFSKGKHRIEVELVNDGFATNVLLSVNTPMKILSPEQLEPVMDALQLGKPAIYLAELRETEDWGKEVVLKIRGTNKPVVIMLNSFGPVHWKIENPSKVEIKAVVFGSYYPGSRVEFGAGTKAKSLYRTEYINIDNEYESSFDGKESQTFGFSSPEYRALSFVVMSYGVKRIDGLGMSNNYNGGVWRFPYYLFQ